MTSLREYSSRCLDALLSLLRRWGDSDDPVSAPADSGPLESSLGISLSPTRRSAGLPYYVLVRHLSDLTFLLTLRTPPGAGGE